MPNRVVRVGLVAVCLVALAGCQVLSPLRISRADHGREEVARTANSTLTEEGRKHLAAQRNGLAIESFNRAIAFGEEPAPALNGLGVAYSRLGRPDLAYRFFRKAAIADPANPVYAKNLVRLTNSPAFTLAQMRAAEPPAVKASQDLAVKAATSPAPRTPGRLYREGNRQFTLVTRSEAPVIRTACGTARAVPKGSACTGGSLPQVMARSSNSPRPESKPVPDAAGAAAPEPGKRKVVEVPVAMNAAPVVTWPAG